MFPRPWDEPDQEETKAWTMNKDFYSAAGNGKNDWDNQAKSSAKVS